MGKKNKRNKKRRKGLNEFERYKKRQERKQRRPTDEIHKRIQGISDRKKSLSSFSSAFGRVVFDFEKQKEVKLTPQLSKKSTKVMNFMSQNAQWREDMSQYYKMKVIDYPGVQVILAIDYNNQIKDFNLNFKATFRGADPLASFIGKLTKGEFDYITKEIRRTIMITKEENPDNAIDLEEKLREAEKRYVYSGSKEINLMEDNVVPNHKYETRRTQEMIEMVKKETQLEKEYLLFEARHKGNILGLNQRLQDLEEASKRKIKGLKMDRKVFKAETGVEYRENSDEEWN